MVRIKQLMVGATLTLAAAIMPASTAFASGPGAGSGNGSGNNGRTQQTLTCGGQTYTVAVTNGGNSVGAGQIVDAHGHGIPTSGTFTVTDTTANVVLFSGPAGNSHGHPNQTTTECTGTVVLGTVADLGPPPPGGWPAGVLPTDTVVGTIDIFVILKV
jgi:hypothetical protein